LNVMV
jgi:hypothetical protein